MFLKITSIIDHTFMSPLVRYHHFYTIMLITHDEEQKPYDIMSPKGLGLSKNINSNQTVLFSLFYSNLFYNK